MNKFLFFAFLVLLVEVLISCAAPASKNTEAKIDESKSWGVDSKRLLELILDRGAEPTGLIYKSCRYARENLVNQHHTGGVESQLALCAFDKNNKIFYASYIEDKPSGEYKIVEIPLKVVVDYSSFETSDTFKKVVNSKGLKGQFQIRTKENVHIFMAYNPFAEMDTELVALNWPKIPPGQIYWWDRTGVRMLIPENPPSTDIMQDFFLQDLFRNLPTKIQQMK